MTGQGPPREGRASSFQRSQRAEHSSWTAGRELEACAVSGPENRSSDPGAGFFGAALQQPQRKPVRKISFFSSGLGTWGAGAYFLIT